MQRKVTMNIPAGAGSYAPEVINASGSAPASATETPGPFMEVTQYQVLVPAAMPAGSSLEVDLLKPGGNPNTPGDWDLAVKSYAAATAGLQAVEYLARRRMRLRGKSGGTAGPTTPELSWSNR